MDSFHSNLRKIMKKRKYTAKHIASLMDVSTPTVTHWANGRRFPKEDAIKELAEILQISVSELFGEKEKTIQLSDEYIELPTIYAGAGAEALAVERAEKVYYPKELLPEHIRFDANTLAIKIVGNSMEPLYFENDIVFIDMVNGREFLPVNGTYLVRYGETVQIKDVEFVGNGEVLLFSRNSPAIINPSEKGLEWEIVGKPFAMLHPTFGSKLRLK